MMKNLQQEERLRLLQKRFQPIAFITINDVIVLVLGASATDPTNQKTWETAITISRVFFLEMRGISFDLQRFHEITN